VVTFVVLNAAVRLARVVGTRAGPARSSCSSADDFAQAGERYDVILDTGGNTSLRRLRSTLTSRGTLVILGGETSGKWLGGIARQLRAMSLSPLVAQKLGTFIGLVNAADLGRSRGWSSRDR
jgi:NADPH:quinone reductase-like Zn-dependent oxidoreductase